MLKKPRRIALTLSCFVWILQGSSIAWASLIGSLHSDLPAARVIQNLTAYLTKHPKDSAARYTLGRTYYAAFTSPEDKVTVYDPNDLKANVHNIEINTPREYAQNTDDHTALSPRLLPDPQRVAYIRLAVDNLSMSVRQAPNESLRRLTLGSAYLDGMRIIERGHSSGTRTEKRSLPQIKDWPQRAAYQFVRSYRLGLQSKAPSLFSDAVALEAAKDFLALASERPEVGKDRAIVREVSAGLPRLQARYHAENQGPFSPIIFSLRQTATLAESIDSHRVATFDLDGSGRPQRYGWVRPDTGILVWDPRGTGKVTSGRQLFGNATWWLFWSDGYAALDALDDNRDGRLSGKELDGIGVWFDRNGDGICEPDEVVSAAKLGIQAISCRSSGSESGMLYSEAGIELQDGTTLKSWDWIAQPSPAKPSAPVRNFSHSRNAFP